MKSKSNRNNKKKGTRKTRKNMNTIMELSKPLIDDKININIIEKANEDFLMVKKSTDQPLLMSLFRKKNKEKFEELPIYKRNYKKYTTELKKEIDRIRTSYTITPRMDYYTYVNYGWLKGTSKKIKKDPKYYVEVDDFRIVQDEVYVGVLNSLMKYIKENPNNKRAQQANAIYKCMMNNTKKRALIAAHKIKDDIEKIIDKEDLTEMLSYLNRDEVISWQAPIVWNVLPDEKNVKKYISHLSPPQLGIYDYFIYIEDPKDSPATKKYKENFKNEYLKFIERVFKTILPNEKYDPMDVWNIELSLLDAMGCQKIKKEDPDFYNVVTKSELENKYGLDWTEFCLKKGYKKENIPNKVIVSSLNALKCTMEILKEKWTSKEWKTWYLFINYKQLIRFEKDWYEIYYDFYGKFVKGQPVKFPEKLYPIFMLSATFNTLLTELYVKDNYDPVKCVYVDNIVNDLKYIFIQKLKRNTWLSPSTKKSAIKKLEKLEVVIGTPQSSSAISQGKDLARDPLLGYVDDNPYYNLKLLSEWKLKRFVELEGKNVIDIPEIDWNEFKMVGTQSYMVNAYYRPTSNSIYVPLAYIQRPFIDLENFSIEYNLAYMGYTIGHELSHSLDDMGSKFDENGNLNDWWTDADRKVYDKKIKDVVKQYEEFAARDGIKFDAEIGVGEDLADISGLSLAEEYLFYFQLVNGDIGWGDLPIVKELSLKLFYIYTALQSRQKIYDKAVESQLKTNPHPLEKYRCNCPLSRLEIFRKIYEVKKGDNMWWHNTDTIW